jgi:hypothetical protein
VYHTALLCILQLFYVSYSCPVYPTAVLYIYSSVYPTAFVYPTVVLCILQLFGVSYSCSVYPTAVLCILQLFYESYSCSEHLKRKHICCPFRKSKRGNSKFRFAAAISAELSSGLIMRSASLLFAFFLKLDFFLFSPPPHPHHLWSF